MMDAEESLNRNGPDRISLWKLDQLMNGDLPEAEAAALREEIAGSPEAFRYLETYSGAKTDLTLAGMGSRALNTRASNPESGIRRRLRSGWRGLGAVGNGPGGSRIRIALACCLALGLGIWTWSLNHSLPSEVHGHGMQPKGGESAKVRILIQGAAMESGEVATAGSGDTLGVTYRSPEPLTAQIWFREVGASPKPMTGAEGNLSWPAAMAWRPAPIRILLEGEWTRQTVWVILGSTPFTDEDAIRAMDGKPGRADLRAEAFRLVKAP